jgi:hypothetical protein
MIMNPGKNVATHMSDRKQLIFHGIGLGKERFPVYQQRYMLQVVMLGQGMTNQSGQ